MLWNVLYFTICCERDILLKVQKTYFLQWWSLSSIYSKKLLSTSIFFDNVPVDNVPVTSVEAEPILIISKKWSKKSIFTLHGKNALVDVITKGVAAITVISFDGMHAEFRSNISWMEAIRAKRRKEKQKVCCGTTTLKLRWRRAHIYLK